MPTLAGEIGIISTRPSSTMFASFRVPAFRLFYLNSTFAAVDMNVRMSVHAWLILELSNGSELWVGVYALVLGAGQLLFSLLAGSIVDRFQRRTILLVEGVVGVTLAWGLAAGTAADAVGLGPAIGLAFVTGCLRAVRFTATNRLVYDLVGGERLVNGISLWRLANTPMMVAGALVAGVLIEWAGIWAAFAFIGAGLTVALPFLALIRVTGTVDRSGSSLLQQTAEGLRYAAENLSLRTLFTVSVVMETLGFSFLVMIPVMAKNVLMVDAVGMGFMQAGVGVGMLLATLFMAASGDSDRKARIVFLNAIGAGVALSAFALSRSLLLSALLAGATMAFLNAYDLTLGALLQLVAPPHLRGRAISLHSLAISFTALGGFAIGAVGSVVGVPLALLVGGGGIVLNAAVRRRALMHIREHPPQPPVVGRP